MLAYHYLVTGYTDAAQRQLERVVALEPRDDVAAQILAGLRSAAEPPPQGSQYDAPTTADPSAAAIESLPSTAPAPTTSPDDADATAPVVSLPGHWRAEPEAGVVIDLRLTDQSGFTWTVNRDGQANEIKGQYSINGPLLILEDPQGEAMLARLLPQGEDRFQFVLLGSPEQDRGLTFQRQP